MHKIAFFVLVIGAVNAQLQQLEKLTPTLQEMSAKFTGSTMSPAILAEALKKIPANMNIEDVTKLVSSESFYKSVGAVRDVTSSQLNNITNTVFNQTQTSRNVSNTVDQAKQNVTSAGVYQQPQQQKNTTVEQPRQNVTSASTNKQSTNTGTAPVAASRPGVAPGATAKPEFQGLGKLPTDENDDDDNNAFSIASKLDRWLSNGCTCSCLAETDGMKIVNSDSEAAVKVKPQQCKNNKRKESRNMGAYCYCQCCGPVKYAGSNQFGRVIAKPATKAPAANKDTARSTTVKA